MSAENINKSEEKTLDKLTRELVTYCCRFKQMLIDNGLIDENVLIKNEFCWVVPKSNARTLIRYEIEGINSFDKCFIDFICKIGLEGEKQARDLIKNCQQRYGEYKIRNYSDDDRPFAWSLWISESRSVLSPYLSILSHILWHDICVKGWERESRYVPALTKAVIVTTIKPQLSKDTKVVVKGNALTCFSNKGEVISTVPCVDSSLINMIRKGMESFPSLCGHKLLRWEVRTGFNNWANCVEDPRLICTSGGYEGISNLIGCGKSKKFPTEIKAILHAQAYGYFNFPQGGTGNMIILHEIEKYRNGEPSKINLILGEMLLPNFTHHLPHGEKRRLIPITELPPLVGSNNTHAAQAMLQILILEEFSNQSDRMASNNCIFMPIERWKDLALEAKLPLSCLSKVINGWTEDDLFSKAFLQKQGDEYTLGADYLQVVDFLTYQGQQRIDGARGGRKSANAKKELIKKGYCKKKKGVTLKAP